MKKNNPINIPKPYEKCITTQATGKNNIGSIDLFCLKEFPLMKIIDKEIYDPSTNTNGK